MVDLELEDCAICGNAPGVACDMCRTVLRALGCRDVARAVSDEAATTYRNVIRGEGLRYTDTTRRAEGEGGERV